MSREGTRILLRQDPGFNAAKQRWMVAADRSTFASLLASIAESESKTL